jgi:hypothetical protein
MVGCLIPLSEPQGTQMCSDTPKNAPKGLVSFKGPTLVRHKDAARFLWGDSKSGEVADVIYGRNDVIGTLIFRLKPDTLDL